MLKVIITVVLVAVVISLFWSFWHLIKGPKTERKVLHGLTIRVVLSVLVLICIFTLLVDRGG
jgi:multisubunit Na+/H+ antiporter MnhF subunit